MKRYICLVILFLTISFSVTAQSIFQHIEKYVGLLKFSYTDSNKIFSRSGTGTILFKALDGKSDYGYCFIVTNKHVLPNFYQSKNIDFYISNSDSSNIPYTKMTIPIYQQDGKYDVHVKVSSEEDIAVIEISKLMEKTPLQKIGALPIENFATRDYIKSHTYNIGDMIFFIGYPNNFFSRKDYSPIFRTGYISSDPLKKFYFSSELKNAFGRDSLNGFLLDGNVFAGSSGSLIFTYPTLFDLEYYKPGHALTTNQKAQCWILGILTESYFTVAGNEYKQRINIGAVISGDEILKLIDSYTYRNQPSAK